MKKLNNPMPSGGAPFTNEDLSEVFQTEIWAALQGMLSQYDAGAEGVIVSGCVVTPNVGNFDMTAGIVYLNGEFMRVDAVTNQTFPKYIKAAAPTNVARVFNDAASKTFIIEKKAQVSATVDAGGQEITISSVAQGDDRRLEVIASTALALKANAAQGAWTNITLVNGWVAGASTPQMRTNQFGKLEMRGIIDSSGASNEVFSTTLTAHPGTALFPVGDGDGFQLQLLEVSGATGRIVSYNTSMEITLDPVSYYP